MDGLRLNFTNAASGELAGNSKVIAEVALGPGKRRYGKSGSVPNDDTRMSVNPTTQNLAPDIIAGHRSGTNSFNSKIKESIFCFGALWRPRTTIVATLVFPLPMVRFWPGRLATGGKSRVWLILAWADCTSALMNLLCLEPSSSCCLTFRQGRCGRAPSCKGVSRKKVWV